jgi:hypothetical protein
MFRPAIVCLIGLFVGISAADAQPRRQIDATPFSHAPCSVLDGQPCTPSFCSVFNDGPCIPEIDYPYGQNLQLTIESAPPQDQAAKYRKPDHDLDTIGDLFAALRSCWSPPPSDIARPGMQMSVRFARPISKRSMPRSQAARRSSSRPDWAVRWPGGQSPSATSTTAIWQSRRRSRDDVRMAHCAPSL